MVQWLRIHLPMQGTWILPMVQEDLTCYKATTTASHSISACTLEPVLCNKKTHCNKMPICCNWRKPIPRDPMQAKINGRREGRKGKNMYNTYTQSPRVGFSAALQRPSVGQQQAKFKVPKELSTATLYYTGMFP